MLVAVALSSVATRAPAQSGGDWSVDGGEARSDEIVRRYRAILEQSPEEGAVFDRMVDELGGGERFERLVADYARLAREHPREVAYPMLLGHLHRRAGRLDEAREAYAAAVRLAPDDAYAHRSLGLAQRGLGLVAEAERSFSRALERATDEEVLRVLLRQLADLAFDARDWSSAERYVQRLIALDPEDIAVRMELADVLMRNGRSAAALAQYEFAIERSGSDTRQRAMVLVDAAGALEAMGRSRDALARYEEAQSLIDDSHWLNRDIEQRVIALYREDGRLPELLSRLERRWSTPTVRELVVLAGLYEEVGRERAAIDAYRRALVLEPGAVDARLALIAALERRGELDAVVSELRTLVTISPDDASFRFQLVDLFHRLGERDEALRQTRAIASRFSAAPHILVDVADRYSRLGDVDAALRTYERLVRIEPLQPANHIALGEFHFMAGRRSEAERVWRRLLNVVPGRAAAHTALAEVFADHGLVEEAVVELEAARRAAPADDSILRALARLYEEARRAPDSLRAWSELSERTDQAPLRAEARAAMVRIYHSLGRLPEVVEERRERFEAQPPDIEAGYFLADAYVALGDQHRAEEVWLALLSIRANDVVALTGLERLYTAQGRVHDAIAILVAIAEAWPQRARESYNRLAELSLRAFDDEGAIRFAQAAVRLNPDNASAHARLADVYRQMQRLDDAVAAYREASRLDPRAALIALDLADLLLVLDRSEEADAVYREIVTTSTDDALILRAGRRSIQINQLQGTLDSLVPVLESRLYSTTTGETYRKLVVEVYERITAPLAVALEYGPNDEREAARAALTSIGRRALRPLLDALAGDDVTTQRIALRVLAAHATPSASLPIARLLNSADPELRIEAALAVARIADPRSVELLERAVESATAPVDRLAVWALAQIGGARALEPLLRIANDSTRDPRTRAIAIVGLGRTPTDDRAVRAILEALIDENRLVQAAAMHAAAVAGVVDAAPTIRFALLHGRGTAPLAATWALALIEPDATTVEALAGAIAFADRDVSNGASLALARLGVARVDTAAVERFERGAVFIDRVSGVFNTEAYIDSLMSWTLIAVDPASVSAEPTAVEFHWELLARTLGSALRGDSLTRRAMLDALDSHRSEITLGGAGVALDRGVATRFNLLVHRALREHRPVLISLADDVEPAVRARAISLLSKIADPRDAERVRAAVHDPSTVVSIAAVEGVGRFGSAEDEQTLLQLASRDDWMVRRAAARALGTTGGVAARAQLAEMAIHDSYASVRSEAMAALTRTLGRDGHGDFGAEVAEVERVALDWWPTATTAMRLDLLFAASDHGVALHGVIDRASADPDRRVRAAASPPR